MSFVLVQILIFFLFEYFFLVFRLAATNGEITITKSHGPSPGLCSTSSTSSSHHNSSSQQHISQMKLSPSSMRLSPTETENSNDLLMDEPSKFFFVFVFFLNELLSLLH